MFKNSIQHKVFSSKCVPLNSNQIFNDITVFNMFFYVTECWTEAEIIEKVQELIEAQDDCRDNPCMSGQCIDLENDYRCDCFSGYAGRNCDLPCPLANQFYRIVDETCLR